MLGVGASLPVSVTISYDEGSAFVDGPMEVEFWTIQISATSAVDNSLVVTPQKPTPSEPETSSEFLSLEQGVLSKYLGDSTIPVIPDDLSLPVTTLSYSYDENTCVAGMQTLGFAENSENALSLCNQYVKPAFLENEELVTISYEDAMEMIDLDSQDIPSVTIGSGITSIGDEAFGKNSLSSVTINTNQSNVTLGSKVFPNGTQIQFKNGTITYGS